MTVTRLAQAGKIPSMRIGKLWRFRASQLDTWLSAQGESSLKAGAGNTPSK
jgi:hypothetical protein